MVPTQQRDYRRSCPGGLSSAGNGAIAAFDATKSRYTLRHAGLSLQARISSTTLQARRRAVRRRLAWRCLAQLCRADGRRRGRTGAVGTAGSPRKRQRSIEVGSEGGRRAETRVGKRQRKLHLRLELTDRAMLDVVRNVVVIGRESGIIALSATAVVVTFPRERAMMLAARQFVQTLSRQSRNAVDGQQRRRQERPHRGRHRDETLGAIHLGTKRSCNEIASATELSSRRPGLSSLFSMNRRVPSQRQSIAARNIQRASCPGSFQAG